MGGVTLASGHRKASLRTWLNWVPRMRKPGETHSRQLDQLPQPGVVAAQSQEEMRLGRWEEDKAGVISSL